MSRYSDNFKTHAFQAKFKDLSSIAEKISLGDVSQTNNVAEILRLKKVVVYLTEILASIDPELTPLSIWSDFNQYATSAYNEMVSYESNGSIVHIQNANTYLDNLLNLVRPYLLMKGKAKSVSENLFAQMQKMLESYIETFQIKADKQIKSLEDVLHAAKNNSSAIDKIKQKTDEFNEKLTGSEDDIGIASSIENIQKDIQKKKVEIDTLYNKLLVDLPKQPSIHTEIEQFKTTASNDKADITAIKKAVEDEVSDFTDFYIKIFGKLNDEDERVGGLSNEITEKLAVLRDLEVTNKTRYEAIIENIESLVPSATSTGLAKAYQDMKDSFKEPINLFSNLFYISIVLLITLSFISVVSLGVTHGETGWSLAYGLTKYTTLEEAFMLNLFKIPLWASLVWFAVFCSRRRSELQRLQQEYAHKEAFASSYISYKQQIEALNVDDNELQKQLISKMIDAISFNASQTLDGKHGDNHPVQDLVEKLSEKIPKL